MNKNENNADIWECVEKFDINFEAEKILDQCVSASRIGVDNLEIYNIFLLV